MIKLWLDGGVWIFVPCRRYQRHTSLHTSHQEEFQELKAKVKASGKRKDVTVPWSNIASYMGLSENSVPLHPMVNDHYPY